jgi:hypothetical protein
MINVLKNFQLPISNFQTDDIVLELICRRFLVAHGTETFVMSHFFQITQNS